MWRLCFSFSAGTKILGISKVKRIEILKLIIEKERLSGKINIEPEVSY